MSERFGYYKAAPAAMKTMDAMQEYVDGCGLEKPLLELVRLRASQINQCAYCVDMHSKDARAAGETEQRLYMLSVWREAPCYTDRERAALAFTEAVTLLSETNVPDAVYNQAKAQFSSAELVNLTMAIVLINSWNRLCVTFRTPAGYYTPQAVTA